MDERARALGFAARLANPVPANTGLCACFAIRTAIRRWGPVLMALITDGFVLFSIGSMSDMQGYVAILLS